MRKRVISRGSVAPSGSATPLSRLDAVSTFVSSCSQPRLLVTASLCCFAEVTSVPSAFPLTNQSLQAFRFPSSFPSRGHSPYIMIMRENESDLRYIRYIVTIPNEMNMPDSALLRKIEMVQKDIPKNMTNEALTYMENDIEDILASTIEGHGIQSVTKKLQNILNKRKTNEMRIDIDLTSNILSGCQVSSSVILDICAVAEKRSRFDFFFKLCQDLCRERVSGALAKWHGIVEEVEHVTSVSELWRLVSHQVEQHFTDEINVIDVNEVAKNIPFYDYLTKQLSPKNEYTCKSERFYSSLQFKLAMSGRSNHVKHPDFNYTQVM